MLGFRMVELDVSGFMVGKMFLENIVWDSLVVVFRWVNVVVGVGLV